VTAEKGVAEERDRARRLSSWGSCTCMFLTPAVRLSLPAGSVPCSSQVIESHLLLRVYVAVSSCGVLSPMRCRSFIVNVREI
jgi:hypothetical protein